MPYLAENKESRFFERAKNKSDSISWHARNFICRRRPDLRKWDAHVKNESAAAAASQLSNENMTTCMRAHNLLTFRLCREFGFQCAVRGTIKRPLSYQAADFSFIRLYIALVQKNAIKLRSACTSLISGR